MGGGEGQRSLGCDSKQATDRYAGLVLEEEGWGREHGREMVRKVLNAYAGGMKGSVSRKSYLH